MLVKKTYIYKTKRRFRSSKDFERKTFLVPILSEHLLCKLKKGKTHKKPCKITLKIRLSKNDRILWSENIMIVYRKMPLCLHWLYFREIWSSDIRLALCILTVQLQSEVSPQRLGHPNTCCLLCGWMEKLETFVFTIALEPVN